MHALNAIVYLVMEESNGDPLRARPDPVREAAR